MAKRLGTAKGLRTTERIGAACFLALFGMSGPVLAAALPPPAPAIPEPVWMLAAKKMKAPVTTAPATPEPGWSLGREKDAMTLFYGMPNGTDMVIAFACAPRSGDIMIRVPEASGKAQIDQSQSVSLTIGGVKSSFAGTVEDQDAGTMLSVTVPSRSPMFTALGGPGGMRIEGKGFSKVVPLKGIREKLRQFLATCRKG
ncbi:MAG: hypothetical protein ACHQAY_21565 [Hyphomicrobiales bacterium]